LSNILYANPIALRKSGLRSVIADSCVIAKTTSAKDLHSSPSKGY